VVIFAKVSQFMLFLRYMDSPTTSFAELLRARGHSLTTARRLVFRELQRHESVTMQQLWKKLSPSIDRASIYRAIGLFVELGVAKRVNVGWKYKLELSGQFAEHHHHLTCNRCGRVVAMNESVLEEFIQYVSDKHGFRPASHQVEIVGVCDVCSSGPTGFEG